MTDKRIQKFEQALRNENPAAAIDAYDGVDAVIEEQDTRENSLRQLARRVIAVRGPDEAAKTAAREFVQTVTDAGQPRTKVLFEFLLFLEEGNPTATELADRVLEVAAGIEDVEAKAATLRDEASGLDVSMPVTLSSTTPPASVPTGKWVRQQGTLTNVGVTDVTDLRATASPRFETDTGFEVRFDTSGQDSTDPLTLSAGDEIDYYVYSTDRLSSSARGTVRVEFYDGPTGGGSSVEPVETEEVNVAITERAGYLTEAQSIVEGIENRFTKIRESPDSDNLDLTDEDEALSNAIAVIEGVIELVNSDKSYDESTLNERISTAVTHLDEFAKIGSTKAIELFPQSVSVMLSDVDDAVRTLGGAIGVGGSQPATSDRSRPTDWRLVTDGTPDGLYGINGITTDGTDLYATFTHDEWSEKGLYRYQPDGAQTWEKILGKPMKYSVGTPVCDPETGTVFSFTKRHGVYKVVSGYGGYELITDVPMFEDYGEWNETRTLYDHTARNGQLVVLGTRGDDTDALWQYHIQAGQWESLGAPPSEPGDPMIDGAGRVWVKTSQGPYFHDGKGWQQAYNQHDEAKLGTLTLGAAGDDTVYAAGSHPDADDRVLFQYVGDSSSTAGNWVRKFTFWGYDRNFRPYRDGSKAVAYSGRFGMQLLGETTLWDIPPLTDGLPSSEGATHLRSAGCAVTDDGTIYFAQRFDDYHSDGDLPPRIIAMNPRFASLSSESL